MDKATYTLLKKFYKATTLAQADIEAITGPYASIKKNNPYIKALLDQNAIEEVLIEQDKGYGLKGFDSSGSYSITIVGNQIYEAYVNDTSRFNKTFVISVVAVIISSIAVIASLVSWQNNQEILAAVRVHEQIYHDTIK